MVCPLGTVTGMLYSDGWLTRIRLDSAEALMPAWAGKEVGTSLGYDVGRLARTFGVSRKAMEIRLEELRLRRSPANW